MRGRGVFLLAAIISVYMCDGAPSWGGERQFSSDKELANYPIVNTNESSDLSYSDTGIFFCEDGRFSGGVLFNTNLFSSLLNKRGIENYHDVAGDTVLTFLLSVPFCRFKRDWTKQELQDIVLAWRNHRVALLSMALEKRFDVNAAGRNGWTPIYLAVKGGRLEECRMLAKAGAVVDETTAREWAKWAKADIAQWLKDGDHENGIGGKLQMIKAVDSLGEDRGASRKIGVKPKDDR